MILAPVIALFVGTAAWRVMILGNPDPLYGVVAGVVSAFGPLFVFAASIGLLFFLSQVSAGALIGAVSEFVFSTIRIY